MYFNIFVLWKWDISFSRIRVFLYFFNLFVFIGKKQQKKIQKTTSNKKTTKETITKKNIATSWWIWFQISSQYLYNGTHSAKRKSYFICSHTIHIWWQEDHTDCWDIKSKVATLKAFLEHIIEDEFKLQLKVITSNNWVFEIWGSNNLLFYYLCFYQLYQSLVSGVFF